MDQVECVGPQLWTWTDSESALRTLFAWIVLFYNRNGFVSGLKLEDMMTDEDARMKPGQNPRIVLFRNRNGLMAIHRSGSMLADEDARMKPGQNSWIEFAQKIAAGMPFSGRPRLDDFTFLVDWLRIFLHQLDEVIQRVKRGQCETSGQSDVSDSDIIPFQSYIQWATEGRVFFTTRRGLMGLGPASMEPGDTINVLPGGKTHYVLRPAKLKNAQEWMELGAAVSTMELVGDCYWNDEQWRGGPQHGRTGQVDHSRDDSQPQGSLPYGILARFLKKAGLDDFGREMIALI